MMTISCDDCVMQDTTACDDCFMTFVLNRQPGQPVELDDDEDVAVQLLTRAGLVPRIRHQQLALLSS